MSADTDGMVKVLSDAKTDRILGVHIIGAVSLPLPCVVWVSDSTCSCVCVCVCVCV